MPFRIRPLNHSSEYPIYIEIIHEVRAQILDGTLSPGDEMPSIRTVAKELGINANTAARAYRELSRDGILKTRRGLTTRVANSINKAALRSDSLCYLIRAVLDEAYQRNVRFDDLLDLIIEEKTRYGPNS